MLGVDCIGSGAMIEGEGLLLGGRAYDQRECDMIEGHDKM